MNANRDLVSTACISRFGILWFQVTYVCAKKKKKPFYFETTLDLMVDPWKFCPIGIKDQNNLNILKG